MLTAPHDRGVELKQIYSELNRKYEEEQAAKQAAELHLPYINLQGFPIDQNVLALVSHAQAEQFGLVAFYREGRNLKLASIHPQTLVQPLLVNLKTQGYQPELYFISQSSYGNVLQTYRKVIAPQSRLMQLELTSQRFAAPLEFLADLGPDLIRASATEVMEALLGHALVLAASDIHLEPATATVNIRFRIDGVLQDVARLPKASQHQLLSRIKILAHLKLNLTTVPQDGSFSLRFDGAAIDVRVSVLPSTFGESVVMRLLRQDQGSLRLADLGLRGMSYQLLCQQIEKPNGMVLTTGPTGSGKTTTLYALLTKLNEPGVKIITLEDPVEYKLPGITQTPIDAGAGMTFASGLRAVLRQDPDVVMVGEMRDLEAAEIAAQAALTGHIVLSTLHTNDAAGAIPRLLDLGVKPFVLAPAINAIVAQRLVRQLCGQCKGSAQSDRHLLARAQMILDHIPRAANVAVPQDLKFYRSKGCPACRGLGYRGRIGVYEILVVNESIEQLINQSTSTTAIRRQAISDGMLTMAQDGILKALEGVTDLEEVFRVTEE